MLINFILLSNKVNGYQVISLNGPQDKIIKMMDFRSITNLFTMKSETERALLSDSAETADEHQPISFIVKAIKWKLGAPALMNKTMA